MAHDSLFRISDSLWCFLHETLCHRVHQEEAKASQRKKPLAVVGCIMRMFNVWHAERMRLLVPPMVKVERQDTVELLCK
jgi:hypothetical protein